jgi:hypothetical protein
MLKYIALVIAFLIQPACSSREVVVGGQTQDLDAPVEVIAPRFAFDTGPVVLVDGAHQNFHTIDDRYAPFARLLRYDGLRVAANAAPFSETALAGADLLVIANADAEGGSAFSPEEIVAVRQFVENGGALLLVVDHTPYPAAAHDLAAAFGADWLNVYSDNRRDGRMTRRSGDLADHPITNGIAQVRTFGGSCFHAQGMRPLLRAGRGWSLQTESETGEGLSPKAPANNCLIGAVAEVGRGRVAFFAEAATFSAQRLTLDGGAKLMGFNAPGAEQNPTFILNTIHWLVRVD